MNDFTIALDQLVKVWLAAGTDRQTVANALLDQYEDVFVEKRAATLRGKNSVRARRFFKRHPELA